MATLHWNVTLLGGLTDKDFNSWTTAANIPSCYDFSVATTAPPRYTYDDEPQPYFTPSTQGTTQNVPLEDNTITITGRSVTPFTYEEPYCYSGHRCVMMADPDDFVTGTKLFSVILASDNLLTKGNLNTIMNIVDFSTWVTTNMPSVAPYMSSLEQYVDADGFLFRPIAENPTLSTAVIRIENAICQYVANTLQICKPSANATSISTKKKQTKSVML